MFSGCPHEGGSQGIQKECPCKRKPLFLSLTTAAHMGDLEGVRAQLDRRRQPNNIDQYGYTPLHYAAQGNFGAIVQVLLKAGALVDGPPPSKCTPLHRAASSGSLDACTQLVEAGAQLEARDLSFGDLRTPLMKACSEGHESVVRLLLGKGSKLEALDKLGRSAAWIAAEGGHRGLLEILREAGADLHSPNDSKESPSQVAAQKGHLIVENYLCSLSTLSSSMGESEVNKEEGLCWDMEESESAGVPRQQQDANSSAEAKGESSGSRPVQSVLSSEAFPAPDLKGKGLEATPTCRFGMQCPDCLESMLVAKRSVCCGQLLCRACANASLAGRCATCSRP